MSIRGIIIACAVGVGVAGSIALGSLVDQAPVACPPGSQPVPSRTEGAGRGGAGGHAHGHADHLLVGPTCNQLEMVTPNSSTYRPDVTGASSADRARARELLRGVNEFCRSHSTPQIMADWLGGEGTTPTHYFDPDRRGSLGLDPSNPRAALVYDGEIGGVMFTGTPLPFLGSIPRAHTHDASLPREMLHVYCTRDLAEAFTPSRRLGVMADAIALREDIRPQIAVLVEPRLTTVHQRVREYVGDEFVSVDPSDLATPDVGNPALRAQRAEIRQSLLLLDEPELRAVLSIVK